MSIEQMIPGFSEAAAEPRRQCAALCFRSHRGHIQVLLITSRDTGRWLLPKGWPIAGLDMAQSAAREAWEEAGAIGEILQDCVGSYPYVKTYADRTHLPCIVEVYPLQVQSLSRQYRERGQRRRRWFALEKAAELLAEPEAQRLVAGFSDSSLAQAAAGSGAALP